MIVFAWPRKLKGVDSISALSLRYMLVLLGIGHWLRSRYEVASPSTGLDYIADVVALQVAGLEEPNVHAVPNAVIFFYKLVGTNTIMAGTINVLADAVAAISLWCLPCLLGCSPETSRVVVSMFLWSPISILSSLSGSTSSLQLAGVLGAIACAAAGRPLLTGLLLAFSMQCSGITPQIVSFMIPIACLLMQNSKRRRLRSRWLDLFALLVTVFCATTAATVATSMILGSSRSQILEDLGKGTFSWLYKPPRDAETIFRQFSQFFNTDHQPWTKLRPNLGIRWYLFAQAFPQFRTFFSYSIEAIYLSMIMMISFAGVSNPITMLCALALLSMMLSAHPTFGDISLWLALLPMLPRRILENIPGKMALALAFTTCLVLNTASYELWLTYETGNANFFFGMNLAWFAWQAFTLRLLLRAQKESNGRTTSSPLMKTKEM